MKQEKAITPSKQEEHGIGSYLFPRKLMSEFADEVARIVMTRIPYMNSGKGKKKKKQNNLENALFLDTSAIIDGRIFGVIESGLLWGAVVVPESILLELKHIADSQDMVKRERGRNGLEFLEKMRKSKNVKFIIAPDPLEQNGGRNGEVDEKLIAFAKARKGRIVTCDFNLTKKARIEKVIAINVQELSQVLKIRAVPGETLHIKILHKGKDVTQGVGYLDDGTMIVVEHASEDIERTVDVVVSRVIQTSAGRILFSKRI